MGVRVWQTAPIYEQFKLGDNVLKIGIVTYRYFSDGKPWIADGMSPNKLSSNSLETNWSR